MCLGIIVNESGSVFMSRNCETINVLVKISLATSETPQDSSVFLTRMMPLRIMGLFNFNHNIFTCTFWPCFGKMKHSNVSLGRGTVFPFLVCSMVSSAAIHCLCTCRSS